MSKVGFIIFFLALANVLPSQNDRFYSEEELVQHSEFLEATAQKYKGELNKAKDLYIKALKKDESNHVAAFEIAKIFVEHGNYDEAIRYGNKALKSQPSNQWYLNFIAKANIETHNYNSAIEPLTKLKTNYPSERAYYEDLAYCYLQEKQSDKAINVLNELESIIGVDERNIKKKYDIYKAKDDRPKAEQELIKLSNAHPNDTRYLNNLASFYSRTDQNSKADEVYKKILEIDPDDTHANLSLASKLNDRNNASSYLLSLRNVLENQEIGIDAKIKELVPYVESAHSGSDSSFIQALSKSLNTLRLTHPGASKAFALSGDFHSRMKEDKQAIVFYEKTLGINDNIFSVWEQLLYSYDEMKDFKSLKQKSEKAMDLFPNQALAYIMHAKALIKLNDKDEAQDLLSEAKLIAGKNKSLLKQIEVLSESIK